MTQTVSDAIDMTTRFLVDYPSAMLRCKSVQLIVLRVVRLRAGALYNVNQGPMNPIL